MGFQSERAKGCGTSCLLARPMLACALLGTIHAAAWAQPIRGDIVSFGFPTGSTPGVRLGQWVPIAVDLTTPGTDPIECQLRCEREDLDGDRVSYVNRRVVVTPGPPKRVWTYAAAGGESGATGTVDVLSADGQLITSMPAPQYEYILNDHLLMVELSQPTLPLLQSIELSAQRLDAQSWGNRKHHRSVVVSRMSALDLPDRWFGLESAQVVVWDQPRLSLGGRQVSDAQIEALLHWVESGGQLVIGLGGEWPALRDTPLGQALPVEGTAPTEQVEALPFYFQRFAPSLTRFKAPIPVASVTAKRGSLTVAVDRLGAARSVPLIVMAQRGSGRIVVCAASLRDLTPGGGRFDALVSTLFDLNPVSAGQLSAEGAQGWAMETKEQRLFDQIVRPVEFLRTGSLLLIVTFAFAFCYITVATLGSWAWLRQRGWTYLSWSVFAGLAVIASAIGIGTVALSRGWRSDVQTVTMLDLEAGATHARGPVMFGFRDIRRERIDLALPGEPNRIETYLRPLTEGRMTAAHYATPVRYTALPDRARLDSVLMRATLKQFEGYWDGPIDGTLRGRLTAERGSGRITPSSVVINDLDVDFDGGYLLYIDPRIRDEVGDVPAKAMGWTLPYRSAYRGADKTPPAVNVLVVRVPPMQRKSQVSGLGAKEYKQLDDALQTWSAAQSPEPKARPEPPTLWNLQLEAWLPAMGLISVIGAEVPSEVAAGLLASTRNLYTHNTPNGGFDTVGAPLNLRGLSERDVSGWLLRGQAVLLVWTDAPSPAALHRRDGGQERPIASRGGRTLYRVRIPIEYAGAPPLTQSGGPSK